MKNLESIHKTIL